MKLNLENLEHLADVCVDSGQLLIVDPCYIDSRWEEKEFQDIRRFRHKTTGDVLAYRTDFPHFEAVIPKYGQTMNQLNQTGGWEPVPVPIPPGLNYDACCRTTLGKDGGGNIDNIAAAICSGYGDGVFPVFVERNADGVIVKVIIDFDPEEENDG